MTTIENATVLVVDDDATFISILARSLTRRGYTVITALSLQDGLNIATQTELDYAIIDLKIDQDSGLHLIQQLHQLYPDLCIVMLTGYASVATAVEAIKLGATHYLCKPASVDDIIAAFTAEEGNADIELRDQPTSIDRLEWEHIHKVLNDNDGNISATARALNMHRRTLQRKLQKYPPKT
jgi:two-component system response regulator RegA